MIIAIDPGKEKCGVAVLDQQGNVTEKNILSPADLPAFLAQHPGVDLVMGDGTTSKQLARSLDVKRKIYLVSERNSTLEARKLYWELNPPKGLKHLIPKSLLSPPCPIDDYAAVVLGRRFLGRFGHLDTPSVAA